MIRVLLLATSLIAFGVSSAIAGKVQYGKDNRGVRLSYTVQKLGGRTLLSASLRCTKNWGGGTLGEGKLVILGGDNSFQESEIMKCRVKGGADGARKRRTGNTVRLVLQSGSCVTAAVGFKVWKNWEDWERKLASEVNGIVTRATKGLVKKPITARSGGKPSIPEDVKPLFGC